MEKYDLIPRFNSQKSFYGKAQVREGMQGDKYVIQLQSYNTIVAELSDGKATVYGTYSNTTLKHIKEFLKQKGFKADNKKQIQADYIS